MKSLTIYIDDADYDRVLFALTETVTGVDDAVTATEGKAKEAILQWVDQIVERHDFEEHQQEHVFVPPGVTAPEPWKQPEGEHDAYQIGDVVLHNDQVWECVEGDGSGNNVWEPGVFGWEVV